jgi:hypothetical protein
MGCMFSTNNIKYKKFNEIKPLLHEESFQVRNNIFKLKHDTGFVFVFH